MPQPCIIPGCVYEGRNKLGVRCRVWHNEHPTKKKTSALWAPDADAYICDYHALGGARITLVFEPNTSDKITILVFAARGTVRGRSVPIRS